MNNKKHFTLNLLFQSVGIFITLILGFISAPLSLSYWKLEQYGIWTLITSFATYFSVSGLGVDVACGILITKNNVPQIKTAILKKGLLILIVSAFFLLLIFWVVNNFFPNWVVVFGKISPDVVVIAQKSTIIFAISFAINLPFGLFARSFAGYQKTFFNNILDILSTILLFCILLFIISIQGSLITYSLLHSFILLFINCVKVILFLITKKKFEIQNAVIIENFCNSENKYSYILVTGARLTFYGMAVSATPSISNMLISNFIGISSVAAYNLIYRLYFYAVTFLLAVNGSIAPLLGKEFAEKNWSWIINKYSRFFKMLCYCGAIIWLGGMLFFRDILYLWIGQSIKPDFLTIIILGAYFYLQTLNNLYYITINSLNYTKYIGFVSWAELLLFILISYMLFPSLGISTLAIALFSSSFVTTQWLLPLIIYKESGKKLVNKYDIPIKLFLMNVLLIPLVYYQQVYVDSRYMRICFGVILFSIVLLLIYFKFYKKQIGAPFHAK